MFLIFWFNGLVFLDFSITRTLKASMTVFIGNVIFEFGIFSWGRSKSISNIQCKHYNVWYIKKFAVEFDFENKK